MFDHLRPLWVEVPDDIPAIVAACREAGWCALDTEADSLHSYFHKVCLIQVSTDGANFVIDPLALPVKALEPLWQLTAEPSIPVLMHGADYDVRVLDRDFGARLGGLVDTQIIAQLLGEQRTGLAALLAAEMGIELNKKHQRADWGARPLSKSMLEYAAADTAFLETLATRMRGRLEEMGRWGWAVEEFDRLAAVRFEPPIENPLSFERVKGARSLKGVARDRFFTLFEWREKKAKEGDVPPFRVLGNRPMIQLATESPRSMEDLIAVDGLGPRFARRWGRAVLGCLARPTDAPARKREASQSTPSADDRRRTKSLLELRDQLAGELKVSPGLLCPRAIIEQVAGLTAQPGAQPDLEQCGLVGWRLEVVGGRILDVAGELWRCPSKPA